MDIDTFFTIFQLSCVGLSKSFCFWEAGIPEQMVASHVAIPISIFFYRCGLDSKRI